MEWCQGVTATISDAGMLAELAAAERENNQRLAQGIYGGCAVCDALGRMAPEVQEAITIAISRRTIGRDKLVTIMQRNGYEVGRRSLERHRNEGHSA